MLSLEESIALKTILPFEPDETQLQWLHTHYANKDSSKLSDRVFENLFAKFIRSKYSLGVTSGTAALRVALSTIDLRPGDEVITQSFTFVATVEAIIEARAIPVLTEIDSTLNLDPNDLLKKITKKTKAVIVVHMLGVPAKLDKIKSINKNDDI